MVKKKKINKFNKTMHKNKNNGRVTIALRVHAKQFNNNQIINNYF